MMSWSRGSMFTGDSEMKRFKSHKLHLNPFLLLMRTNSTLMEMGRRDGKDQMREKEGTTLLDMV